MDRKCLTVQLWQKIGAGLVLAFDIGGARIKAARGGQVLGEVPTPLTDFVAFSAAVRGFLTGGGRGVALSVTGIVPPEGPAKVANIPCRDGRDVVADLRAALGLPILVVNDADCLAMAEATEGAGRGHGNAFAVILGSGGGGGLVIDGRLLQGAGGFAGEWGHGPVIRDPAFACGCGQTGWLDTVGSARGLERLHRHLAGQDLTSLAILARLDHGQSVAAMDLRLDLVSGVLSMVVNLVGCSVVPVGGGGGGIFCLKFASTTPSVSASAASSPPAAPPRPTKPCPACIG